MERILITGARGFTAKYLAKKLSGLGHEVYATTLSENGINSDSHCFKQVVLGDLSDKSSLLKSLELVKPNRVIHLGGISYVGHSNPVEFYNVNTLGSENLLMAIEESHLDIKSILMASSANVYGIQNVEFLDENAIPSPVNHYAISKLSMEYMARTYMPRLPIIITRPFNYIGFGQSINFVIPKIVKAFAEKQPQVELGNTHISRDFSAIDDVVDAYIELLFSKKSLFETFNICSGRATSLTTILEILTDISGHKLVVQKNSNFVRENEIETLFGSNKKLRHYTNWSPKVPINKVLEDILKQYQNLR